MSKLTLSLAALLVSAPVAFAEAPHYAGNYDASVLESLNNETVGATVEIDNTRTSSIGGGNTTTVPVDSWDQKSGR